MGKKMSKSYNNFINIFLPDNKLRKQIMGIKTDSSSMEDKKDAELCNVYKIYKLLSTEEQAANLLAKYAAGNYGYGQAKLELFELICDTYSKERKRFNYLMENKILIDNELDKGAIKARVIAKEVIERVRKNIGY
jgi:tryptophanyl-tRNA synthetase